MSCATCGHAVDDHNLNDGAPATACFAEQCQCSEYEIEPIAPTAFISVNQAIADAVKVAVEAERKRIADFVAEELKHDFDGGRLKRAILALE